ncbi:hypothetical protein [Aurantiacibacter sp. MUD61]|uniref:hypothetical protein n=1 Tax=Aurantiacibacter sp. MUD61 TaxID=3009083 RepID=UPI0022F0F985|nr:hypothetical protein [Aurantiacibacter sp. MUD61]
MSDEPKAVAPYKMGEETYADLAALAAGMAENHELASEHLERGYIQKWIEEDLREYDARIALDKLLEENFTDLALFEFALRYAPDWTPVIEGFRVEAEFLDEYFPQLLKDDYVVSTNELVQFAARLYSWGVLTDERVSKGNAERWAAIDAAWRREFHESMLTHGETLLYRSLWKAPGNSLEGFLMPDRYLELVMARAAADAPDHDPEEFETLKSMMASKEKLALLAELWASDDPVAHQSPRLKVEDGLYYNAAKERAWFVDMVESDAVRTPGREAELHTAAKIAARQQNDVEHAETMALAQSATAAGGDSNFFTRLGEKVSELDPKIRAGLFAAMVFIPMIFYDSRGDGATWWLLTWAGLAATIGMGSMRPLPVKPTHKWIDVLGAGGIALVLFAYFEGDIQASSFVFEAILASAAGAAGFFWSQLGAFRANLLAREVKKTQSSADPNDTQRITPDALATVFFPERILDIPFAQRTPKQREFAAALQTGHSDTTGLARFADRRSPAAPNHGDGLSTNIGGFNVASDGTTTMQLMDGVSMDTKGNWNMRVVDGVTIHNDGKHTVSMGGFDVRSDGQISTSIGGVRVSSGGEKKEEKKSWLDPKEETDWFGNKTKKGWFD